MTEMLAEQPLIVAFLLGAATLVALFFYSQASSKIALAFAGVFATLIPASYALSSVWVTPREELKFAIESTADALVENDIDSALSIINDPILKSAAQSELRNVQFRVAKVTAYRKVDVHSDRTPVTANVDMNVLVEAVGGRAGRGDGIRMPRRLRLSFEKKQDKWIVTDYEHLPIVGKADGFSSDRPGR